TPELTDFTGDDELLQLVASAEKGSEHPLATAIVTYAEEKGLDFLEPDNFAAIAGHGIEATFGKQRVLDGTRKLMHDEGIEVTAQEKTMQQFEMEGKTAMLIAVDGVFQGIVAVADTVKDTAMEAMKILHENNMELVMLTGDNERTAQAIARQ